VSPVPCRGVNNYIREVPLRAGRRNTQRKLNYSKNFFVSRLDTVRVKNQEMKPIYSKVLIRDLFLVPVWQGSGAN